MPRPLLHHYITLEYWGKYLRQIIKELLIHHRLRIPTWDLHIGFGSDIVTTLHYYVIGDPLNLCAAFVPVRYTEYLYDFLCFFRYYLEDGSSFGTLTDVMETGANDVYVVENGEGEEILLPAIRECILDVDVEKNVMTIHLMKGLI